MEFRSRYSVFQRTANVKVDCSGDVRRTKQEFKDECNINNIVKAFDKGQLPNLMKAQPLYGDFSAAPDYQEALNLVMVAERQFSALPAKIRARFLNDPHEFLMFVGDPKNNRELVSMGLALSLPGGSPKVPVDAVGGVPAAGEGPKT